ncbi:VanZ family protein [Paenibacillus solani]|uniref:Teicoplanin resistance protein VanZ n=1 Tax=Paenibacillus solani TaxID=1705565 RepID=A0A0M1P3G7_9BACL|nr:VanZ family protein [Paenibacillus solani]KOR89028.1 teicoplanin resistance protein VanZ [Paenibacillus solani]
MKLSYKWFLVIPCLVYLYILLKVILFKFGSVDLSFLWEQLNRAIENPQRMQNRLQLANLTPFESIRMNLKNLSSPHDVINLFGNIAIFMPTGIFVGLLFRSKLLGFIGTCVISFALSLGLECSQLVFTMGTFDVDDLILNTMGGVLGYLVFLILRGLYTAVSSIGPVRTGEHETGSSSKPQHMRHEK